MATQKEQPKEKPKKLANKCLLLKTPDQRCFFTEEKNYPILVEFGRTFDAEISIVKTKEQVEILELDDLAKSICSQNKSEYPEYEIVETKLSAEIKKTIENRAARLKQAKEVSDYIRGEMMEGKTVALGDLDSKFPQMAKSCLSNYFTRVRRELSSRGHIIKRNKPGQWRIASQSE